MTKSITIKNAKVTDKQYLDNLAITSGISVSVALSAVINIAKTYEKTAETLQKTIEETGKLKEEIQNLKDSFDLEATENRVLRAENEALKNQEPQTVEKTVEVERKLDEYEFYCKLDNALGYNTMKIRRFAVKRGIVNFTERKDYPGELAKIAITEYLNRHFADYIN